MPEPVPDLDLHACTPCRDGCCQACHGDRDGSPCSCPHARAAPVSWDAATAMAQNGYRKGYDDGLARALDDAGVLAPETGTPARVDAVKAITAYAHGIITDWCVGPEEREAVVVECRGALAALGVTDAELEGML